MGCFPKIDQPCPLGVDAQKRLNGYCGQCRKTVHSLDGLDGAARSSLLATAGGPICVSYRVPARIGAALMLSMVGAAFASENSSTQQLPQSTSPPVEISSVESNVILTEEQIDSIPDDDEMTIMLGGISEPQSAEWVDTEATETLPELPVIVDDAP